MKNGIKVKADRDPVTGELRVPPKVLELLTGLADHSKICPDCEKARTKVSQLSDYCPIGRAFLEELSRQPEVEPM